MNNIFTGREGGGAPINDEARWQAGDEENKGLKTQLNCSAKSVSTQDQHHRIMQMLGTGQQSTFDFRRVGEGAAS